MFFLGTKAHNHGWEKSAPGGSLRFFLGGYDQKERPGLHRHSPLDGRVMSPIGIGGVHDPTPKSVPFILVAVCSSPAALINWYDVCHHETTTAAALGTVPWQLRADSACRTLGDKGGPPHL